MLTLRKGNKGSDVTKLQQALTKAGCPVNADGDFGLQTEIAVKLFQWKNHVVQDGIVGSHTWQLLAPYMNATEASSSTRSIDPSVEYMPIDVHITKCSRRTPKYLIIHYTAGSRSSAGAAKANRNVFLARSASADFIVDDNIMLQVNPNPTTNYCWAVGDSLNKYSGGGTVNGIVCNANSISIELCSTLRTGATAKMPNHTGWSLTDATLNNAARLARILMAKYNIPINNVLRHYDVTGKLCPGLVGWNDAYQYDTKGNKTTTRNTSIEWQKFKNRLK